MLVGKSGPVDPSTLEVGLPSVSLYGGEVSVVFDATAHRYTVSDVLIEGGKPFTPPSVTRVLGAMIDRSEFLIPWAAKCSRETVTKLIQPGVAYTAEEIGRISYQVADASKGVLKTACDVGHEFHEWTQNYLLARGGQTDYPTPPQNTQVRNCCRAAREWILKVDLQPFSVERILYSRAHKVIGTADVAALSTISGRTAVIDWKSSGALHDSYRLQTAIYRLMLHEMTNVWTDDRWLIRVEKNPAPDDPGFHPLLLRPADADKDTEAFLGMLTGYRRLKELEACSLT